MQIAQNETIVPDDSYLWSAEWTTVNYTVKATGSPLYSLTRGGETNIQNGTHIKFFEFLMRADYVNADIQISPQSTAAGANLYKWLKAGVLKFELVIPRYAPIPLTEVNTKMLFTRAGGSKIRLELPNLAADVVPKLENFRTTNPAGNIALRIVKVTKPFRFVKGETKVFHGGAYKDGKPYVFHGGKWVLQDFEGRYQKFYYKACFNSRGTAGNPSGSIYRWNSPKGDEAGNVKSFGDNNGIFRAYSGISGSGQHANFATGTDNGSNRGTITMMPKLPRKAEFTGEFIPLFNAGVIGIKFNFPNESVVLTHTDFDGGWNLTHDDTSQQVSFYYINMNNTKAGPKRLHQISSTYGSGDPRYTTHGLPVTMETVQLK
ncbi:hypothetical protein [Vibrio phage CKB-S2]|nr:hypothetical protein [Vibrio phage CKB-S2]